MKKPFLTIIVIVIFSFCVKAQDAGFNNFVKKEGFVKFTDTAHLPLHVKRYYHLIEKFFSRNHFDKTAIYIESSSVKVDNGFLDIGFMGIDRLKKLENQKKQNQMSAPWALVNGMER